MTRIVADPPKRPLPPACLNGRAKKSGRRSARLPREEDSGEGLQVVSLFAVLVDVEAFALDFFGHTQTDDQVNDLVGNQGNHG